MLTDLLNQATKDITQSVTLKQAQPHYDHARRMYQLTQRMSEASGIDVPVHAVLAWGRVLVAFNPLVLRYSRRVGMTL